MYTIAEVQQHEELLDSHRINQFQARIRRQKSAQRRRDLMRNAPSTVISYNKDADLRNFAHWGDDEKIRLSEDYTPPTSRLQNLREANQSFTSRRNDQDTFHARMRSAGF